MPRAYLTKTCLQSVPLELVCLILESLEMQDLLTCTQVSKYLKKAVNESSKLQYIIELAKHRMVTLLSSSAAPSHAIRLNLLRERERAWKYLDFRKRHTLRLPPTGSVYEFVGGYYGNGREDETRATASISFLELPSYDSGMPGNPQHELQIWTHRMDDVTIIDFTMDPSQDLLVLVALAPADSKDVYELHLRSIKTNQPHPRAPVPILHCTAIPAVPPQPSEIVAAVRVQVFGDLVALLIKEVFENTGAHLEIWNWESGSTWSSSMTRMSGIDDFTFLTRDSFLLVRPSGRFEVYQFADPVNQPTAPVQRYSYAFPPLAEGYIYWYISMSSNPAPGYVPRSSSDPTRDQDGLPSSLSKQTYFPHPDERIHACCLYIFNPVYEENPVVHSFVFFINLETLSHPPAEWLVPSSSSTRRSGKPRVPSARWTSSVTPGGDQPHDNNNSSSPASSPTATEFSFHGGPSQGFSSPSSGGSASTTSSPYPPFPSFDSAPVPQPAPSIPTFLPPPPTSASHLTSDGLAYTSPGRRRNHEGGAQTVPWEVWGPSNTRWFEECLSTDWQHAIYGLRTVESVRPDKHPDPRKRAQGAHPPWSRSGGSHQSSAHEASDAPSSAQTSSDNEEEDHDDVEEPNRGSYSPQRYLRIRNFNTYAFKDSDLIVEHGVNDQEVRGSVGVSGGGRKGKGRCTDDISPQTVGYWNRPRLVKGPSTTLVKGVFQHDIVSSLPYIEMISEETYGVTDVMMDDCRLLLLKRGKSGKLKNVEVLMA